MQDDGFKVLICDPIDIVNIYEWFLDQGISVKDISLVDVSDVSAFDTILEVVFDNKEDAMFFNITWGGK